jgi:hypothetical protein
MSSIQRRKMTAGLAEYYIEKGKIFDSSVEYSRQNDAPYTIKEIKKVMGGWSMCFKYINTEYPNIQEDIKKAKKKGRGDLFKDKPSFPESRIPSAPKPGKITLTTGRNETNE